MNKTKILGIAVLLAASVMACNENSNSTADNSDSTEGTIASPSESINSNDSSAAQSDDGELVTELIQSMNGGLAVMQQGQEKSTIKPVKDLAKKLETAHTALTKDLTTLANTKGWTVPSGASENDTEKAADLVKESSPEYEKEWLEALKDRHETNIRKLENHKTTDSDLQALSAKALPKLNELLSSIEVVQKSMK